MGMNPSAEVVYGYALGSEDGDWKIAEYDADRLSLNVEWYTRQYLTFEDPSYGFCEYSKPFEEALTERIAQKCLGLPVELMWHGHHEYDSGRALIVKDSELSVEWSQTLLLDLTSMREDAFVHEWDGFLTTALEALEIHPVQERAGWLLTASYG